MRKFTMKLCAFMMVLMLCLCTTASAETTYQQTAHAQYVPVLVIDLTTGSVETEMLVAGSWVLTAQGTYSGNEAISAGATDFYFNKTNVSGGVYSKGTPQETTISLFDSEGNKTGIRLTYQRTAQVYHAQYASKHDAYTYGPVTGGIADGNLYYTFAFMNK